MNVLDGLLVVIGLGSLLWGSYRQTVGMLITWLGFYLSVIFAGTVVLLLESTYGVGANLARSLWGSPGSFRPIQAMIFLVLGTIFFVVYEVVSRMIFPNPGIPELGFLDNLLGGIIGGALGLAAMAILGNLWRVVVSASWQPYDLWVSLDAIYRTSILPLHLRPVLVIFNKTLLPFLVFQFPAVLVP
ncbi:MAG: hypothetical protein DRI37_08395 [Chloroflexi bacterium]|nr:hypothetical protein [Anaerolineae bacterium]RLC85039.1 MAG: hypothetical protein DRI37_08395 [Chloroflexota bacterium]